MFCAYILTYACKVLFLPRSTIHKLDLLIDNAIKSIYNDAGNIASMRSIFGVDNLEDIISRRLRNHIRKMEAHGADINFIGFRSTVNALNRSTSVCSLNIPSSFVICREL
jgi:hypothetical protein